MSDYGLTQVGGQERTYESDFLTPGMPEREPGYISGLPRAGTQIGQYEVIRELGRGGMGAVFLARDTKLGRKVAIKFLFSSNQPELTARFIIEARATARCSHENIVVIHEVDEHNGHPFMVLEYLQGAPLAQRLAGGAQLSHMRALELIVPVVRALSLAHEAETTLAAAGPGESNDLKVLRAWLTSRSRRR